MLCAENISKRLGGSPILHDLSLAIAPGEITAVLGPSGAGKSTLLRALSLLDPPDEGSVRIDELVINCPIPRRDGMTHGVWPNVTVVFQQLFLWPHLTVEENIALPLQRYRNGSLGIRDDVYALMEHFDIAGLSSRYPNQISLGQRQRVALVRALALKPRYLLLDEITSALDVEHVGKVLEHLKEARSTGMGIMLITHLVGFARNAADQVLFMEDGRLLESGDATALLHPNNTRFRKFLNLVEAAS